MRPLRGVPVEMWCVWVAACAGVVRVHIARAEARMLVPVAVRITGSTTSASASPAAFCAAWCSLPWARVAVEAWWRATEDAVAPAEPRGRPATGGTGAVVRGIRPRVAVVSVVLQMLMVSRNVAVVYGTLLCVAEHGICLGDAHEAAGGMRVLGVVIWVVEFGELIERSNDGYVVRDKGQTYRVIRPAVSLTFLCRQWTH